MLDFLSGNSRIPKDVKKAVMLAEARAREALSNVHKEQALRFVRMLSDYMAFDEALERYLDEMNLGDEMTTIVRTRVLSTIGMPLHSKQATPSEGSYLNPLNAFRRLRESRERERIAEERARFLLAQALDAVIQGHVEAAQEFVSVFRGYVPAHRAIELYTEIRSLSAFLAEAVFQQAMSRLAESYLSAQDEEMGLAENSGSE